MQKAIMAAVTAATIGSAALLAAPAQARTAPVKEPLAALQKGELQTSYVQYRSYYGRPGYYGHRAYGPRYGYYPRGYYYRRDYGAAAAAGALGLATGAIIGGAIAQQQAAPTYVAPGGGSAYCAQRYRSYDPASGTFLGYDGVRHPCP